MNILYKYCDQGVIEILKSLELKLPSVSEVNDPLECLPFIYCPNDKSAMKVQWIRTFNHNNINPPENWEQRLNELFEKGEIQNNLIEGLREELRALRMNGFLLSVSKTPQNTVMWAHYSDKHRGAVIGIDFNKLFPDYGLKMNPVIYSKQRPELNALDNFEGKEFQDKYYKTLSTKSTEWTYEQEFRTIFENDYMVDLEQNNMACQKNFRGRGTWFLRLTPESVKEIIFGLYTEDNLKTKIRELIKQSELQHVKIYHIKESDTYTFDLIEED